MYTQDDLPDSPSAPHLRSLLLCPQCQAPCPLGFTTTTQCVACQTAVELSNEIIAAREERRARNRKHREGDPLWRSALGSRPRWWRATLFIAPLSFFAP